MSTAKDQQLDKAAGQPARSGAAAGGTTQGEGNIGGTGGGAPDKAEGLVTSVADMTIGSLDPTPRHAVSVIGQWRIPRVRPGPGCGDPL